jgi:hypothetical protein
MTARNNPEQTPGILSRGVQSSLQEAVAPAAGYHLTHALMTSYSIDRDVVMALLCNMAGQGEVPLSENGQDGFDWRLHLLSRIKSLKGKVAFCFEMGRISPGQASKMDSLLPAFLCQIRPRAHQSFHPKLSILRFAAGENSDIIYRVLCSSRNLTRTPMWEVLFFVEGRLVQGRASRAPARGRELLPFIRHVFKPPSISTQFGEIQRTFLRELPKVNFSVDSQPVKEWQFLTVLSEGTAPRVFTEENGIQRALVVSPFVDRKFIQGFARDLKLPQLDVVCRAEESNKLKDLVVERLTVRDFDPRAEDETLSGSAYDNPGDLHAKLYLAEYKRETEILVGSANATCRAWEGRNTEAMARLRYRGTNLIDGLLADFARQLSAPKEPVDLEKSSHKECISHLVNGLRRCRYSGKWKRRRLEVAISSSEFRLPPCKWVPCPFRGEGRLRITMSFHSLQAQQIAQRASFQCVYEKYRCLVSADPIVIESMSEPPSPFLSCQLELPDEQVAFVVLMELKNYDFEAAFQSACKNLTPADWSVLLWSALGNTLSRARHSAGKGRGVRRTSDGGNDPLKGRPLLEDLLYGCVSDPRAREMLWQFVGSVKDDDPYKEMVKNLLRALNCPSPVESSQEPRHA